MNQQKEGMTMEEKKAFDEKKKAAAKAYAERKNQAREKIEKWLDSPDSKNLPNEVREAIKYFTGKGVRMSRSGVVNELREMLLAGPVSGVEIFQKFEYGRPTMNQKINGFIKASPESRIWVAFENGNYVVKGTGPNPPKGWTGYLPPEKEEL
jgi:hypothetical protein